MMLDNSTYNKIKILHELSSNIWFIQKHAIPDAEKAGDKDCLEILLAIERDLQKHLEKLQNTVCIISQ